MYKSALAAIAECDACYKGCARFVAKNLALRPTAKGERPFWSWAIDLIPNLGPEGYAILLMVCTFSKWVEIAILPHCNAASVW